jgi:hypothetical protein
VKGQLPLSVEGLRGQGVEQFGRSEPLVSGLPPHLSFLDHGHELNPNEGVLGCRERCKPSHGPCHPLYPSMILFDYSIKVFDLADDDRRAVLSMVTADRRRIGFTAINRDLLRHTVPPNRLFQKAQRCRLIPVLRQEKVHGLPRLIHGAIEIVPLAFDFNRGLVQAPTQPHRPLAAMKHRFQQGTVLHHPPLKGRVVNRHAAFLHELFDMPVAQGIGDLPPHPHQNNILRKMGSLETDRHRRSPSLRTVGYRERP